MAERLVRTLEKEVMTFDLPSPTYKVLKHTQVISGVQDIELLEGPFNTQQNDLIDYDT